MAATTALAPTTAQRLSEAQEKLAALRAKGRENMQGKGASIEAAAITAVGGAASGALVAYMPKIAGMDSRPIVGALTVAAGVFGVKGKIGAAMTLAGGGILAGWIQDMVADAIGSEEETTTTEEAA